MKTLLILFGGTSSEYPVSLQSASAVIDAVDRSVWNVMPVGITRSGQWLWFPGGTAAIREDTWYQDPACVPVVLSPSREDHGLWLMAGGEVEKRTIDLAFPVLHGRFGEDGTVQGLLELSGIPFVGCGSLSSALCMDKAIAHSLAEEVGIRCPQSTVLYSHEGTAEELAGKAMKALAGVPLPWFVKPASEGSSFGITRVSALSELSYAIHTALRYGDKITIEQGIDGYEVGCAVLGGSDPVIGEVDAIQLAGGFFDYHEKYNLETARILLPAPAPVEKREEIRGVALALYRLFGCKGLARVDLFLTPEGNIIFNEINTIPGMTNHSRYPGMLGAIGISFKEMVAQLLKGALKA